MQKNLLVAQSGGPTAAINATLSGILKGAKSAGIPQVFGGLYGIQGILEGQIIRLDDQLTCEEDYRLLECTPAMALGSCRYKMPDAQEKPALYRQLLELLNRYEIGYFFYIGGNDSMDTVDKLSEYFRAAGADIRVVGVPKTIDNDLAVTDHTPGFGSAVKFVATAVLEIARDAAVYRSPSVTIVEIMGRDAGWLTAASGLCHLTGSAAPHRIYLPERPFSAERFVREVRQLQQQTPNLVIAVSEGIRVSDGEYAHLEDAAAKTDAFGHVALAGTGRFLERLVKERIGCKVRSVELSVLQRAAAHFASAADLAEAVMVGQQAVELALAGKTGVMAAIERISEQPYRSQVVAADISQIANRVKPFPLEWLDPQTHRLTAQGLQYYLPLVQGEVALPTQLGLPRHFTFRTE